MSSIWHEEVLQELEQAKKIIRDLEARLCQTKTVEIPTNVSVVEAKSPEPSVASIAPVIQPPNHRQVWCLQQLWAGQILTRKMVEQQFSVTSKTAKRDLSELIRLQQVRFVRIPRPGHYELQRRNAKRSEPADPKVQIAEGNCAGDFQI